MVLRHDPLLFPLAGGVAVIGETSAPSFKKYGNGREKSHWDAILWFSSFPRCISQARPILFGQ